MSSSKTTYAVKTPLLFWFGAGGLLVTIAMVTASWGAWLGMFLLCTMFGGLSAALFFMSATISVDSDGLTVKRPASFKAVKWSQVKRVAEGGGNFVIYTDKGRITAPSFEFWAGPGRSALIALLAKELEARGIPLDANSLRAAMHVGDR